MTTVEVITRMVESFNLRRLFKDMYKNEDSNKYIKAISYVEPKNLSSFYRSISGIGFSFQDSYKPWEKLIYMQKGKQCLCCIISKEYVPEFKDALCNLHDLYLDNFYERKILFLSIPILLFNYSYEGNFLYNEFDIITEEMVTIGNISPYADNIEGTNILKYHDCKIFIGKYSPNDYLDFYMKYNNGKCLRIRILKRYNDNRMWEFLTMCK